MEERFEYLSMVGLPANCAEKFVARLAEGKVSCKFSMDKYSADVELQEMIRLLKLDTEKFFYSDETLKGFMRQYRDRALPQNGSIYD